MGNGKSKLACLEVRSRGCGRLEKVQVLRPDGKYEEFADPIEVSVVMRMHPDHLLVHCCSSRSLDQSPVSGALNKIMIMRPDQELAVGQSYLLHPIPPQYRRTMFKAHSVPLPRSPLGLAPTETDGLLKNIRKSRKLKKLSPKRAKRLAALRDLCADLLQPLQPVMPAPVGRTSSSMIRDSTGPSILSSARGRQTLGLQLALSKEIAEAPNAPLLDSRLSSPDNTLCSSDETSSFSFNGWKPSLDSIPESPGRSLGSDLQSTHTIRGYHRLADPDQGERDSTRITIPACMSE